MRRRPASGRNVHVNQAIAPRRILAPQQDRVRVPHQPKMEQRRIRLRPRHHQSALRIVITDSGRIGGLLEGSDMTGSSYALLTSVKHVVKKYLNPKNRNKAPTATRRGLASELWCHEMSRTVLSKRSCKCPSLFLPFSACRRKTSKSRSPSTSTIPALSLRIRLMCSI
jgi:hypothetical protein